VKTESAQVETRFFTFADGGDPPLELQSGERLGPLTVAYEQYGELSPARDNAILLFHALSGSQHASGSNPSVPGVGEWWTDECQAGWWDGFIGPGKALDTDRFCVICANFLGGCYGSTGPASIRVDTGKPYGSSFPRVTFSDIVDTQVRLLDHLGIQRLRAVIGASVGGMMCVDLATRYPDRVRIVIPIASGLQVTPLQRLHNFEQIYAIERDPNFRGGDYYDGPFPEDGLALARMIGHKTFVSLSALEDRARTEVVQAADDLAWYRIDNSLESYMLHQGTKFTRRFDANTYLRITDAWQRFDLKREAGSSSFDELFARCQHQWYLIFSIDSDVAFYPEEQEEMVRILKRAGVASMRITVHSEKGHDSFLLEPELFTPHLAHTLNGGGPA